MGVNSLWDILGPSARPVRLEALSRKKLAVDASIWIYQFLKAVRDQEGNSMPQAHIVGFFRRICKLLYFGIYPIFVFDGGAPALKRQTINQRRERREGKKESKEQTARKLLAIQVHRKADQAKYRPKDQDFNDETVYLEDLPNLHPLHGPGGEGDKNQLSPEKHTKFVKKDEYHLPELKKIKAPNGDLRIMPEEEFDELAKESFDNVNGVDINTVDPNSKEFLELPLETQYMVLSHLRLRSRLRMGFNKDQLENLFPNSMDFSKFQIQQVQKRNFYTQKLMNVSGMGDEGNATRRIAGDKDRKYALVRNDDGWTLALDENGSSIDKPIALDSNTDENKLTVEANNNKDSNNSNKSHKVTIVESDNEEEEEEEEEIEWDDVPLEGNDVEETEEEKDVQKAIIESIYNMYEDKTSDDSHSAKELRQAIESSKKDLLDLKIREEDMILNGILNWRNDLMTDDSQEQHDYQKNETELKPLPDLQSFSFGQSMLFQNALETEADDIQKSEANNVISSGDDKKNPTSNVLTFQKQINSDLDNPKNVYMSGKHEPEVVQLEDELTDMTEERSNRTTDNNSGTTANIKNQPLPLWFNEEISQMGNYEQETFVPENDSKKRKYQEDEEVGLISWNEAKDMMGDDYEKDYSDASIEEVQVNNDKVVDNNNNYNSNNNTSTDIGRVDSTSEPTAKIADESRDKDKERKGVVLDYDFEEEDEEQFIEQMKEEENEHEMFKSHIRANHEIPPPPIHTSVTNEQLLQEQLQKAKRDSDEVTETMIRDVQELLRRFGIPYITAPMEAEAQCAELLKLNLVDGIITDDSDCFLFGGDKVYKNMFNQKQYVECYIMNDINSRMGLSQEKLIDLALLLGSDYTEGIKGIGPVMAMEILAEFGSLKKFKQWFDENTKTTVPPDKSGLTSIKRSLLNRIKNGTFFLPESFPDNVIFDAYKQPEVDHDKSEFKWGVPSLDQIRSFLMYNVSWSQARVDEVMVPLIRDMNRKKAEGTQSTISEFFPQDYIQTRKEIGLGKRMKTAAQRLNKNKKG